MFGSIAAGLLGGAASSIGSSALGYLGSSLLGSEAGDRSEDAAANAYYLSRIAYQHRYQDTVADMKAAGLNPILAAGGGFQVGQGVTAPMAQSFTGNMTSPSISSSAKDFQEIEQSKAEIQKKEAEINEITQTIVNKKQEVIESIARTSETRAKEGVATQTEMLIGKQIINTIEQTSQLAQSIRESRTRMGEISSRTDLNVKEIERVKADTAKLIQITKNLEAEYTQLQKVSDVYKIPYYGEFLAGTKALINALTGGLVGSAMNAIK